VVDSIAELCDEAFLLGGELGEPPSLRRIAVAGTVG
jgi:hypothetical protein